MTSAGGANCGFMINEIDNEYMPLKYSTSYSIIMWSGDNDKEILENTS